jgi:hypothetical protein
VIEKWIQLAEATGLAREQVIACSGILPGVRYAVDAYLSLVQNGSLLVAVASSLTELFSRDLISLRMEMLREHYPYLANGLAYFEGRLTQAPEDAAFALDYVCTHASTREQQESAIAALTRKCEILWAQLDAIDYAYVEPGNIPPGCFAPQTYMELTATPRLSSGCRLHPTEAMLLIPEGALKLTGPARDILLEVNGSQTVAAIIEKLLTQYPGASAADIGRDVQALLDRMQQRGVVRL